MRITDRRFTRLMATVEAITLSPRVGHYRIGYTGRSMQARSDQYYTGGEEWDHLVALADKLSMNEALNLERDLQEKIRRYTDPRTCLYRKFDWRCVEDVYRRSSGGRSDDGSSTHTVYMAWTEHRYTP